jgi:hypothetical protein
MMSRRSRNRRKLARPAIRDEREFAWRSRPAGGERGRQPRVRRSPAVGHAGRSGAGDCGRPAIPAAPARDPSATSSMRAAGSATTSFEFMVSQRVTLARYREWRTPLNSDSGSTAMFSTWTSSAAPQTVADYERLSYDARCAAFLRRARRQHADRHARRPLPCPR